MGATAALHPADPILQAYGLGKLDDASSASVSQHLEACDSCRQRVADVSSDDFLGRLQQAKVMPDGVASEWSPSAESSSDEASDQVVPPPPADTLPPELVDHPDYEIVRELGRGGMGVVYLANNLLMGRPEVLKVVGRHLIERPGVADRFLREIRSAAMLHHANIVAAYTAMRLGKSLVLAMEYVDGLDLAAKVKDQGPLPVAHACYFIHQAALGLQHAHERGMVHRDVKPANLILARDGKKAIVKVLDFGLAKVTSEGQTDSNLTREGQMVGTPDYIAPEQIRDAKSADIRADIYSLGCTLYYLLTGGPPFRGDHLWDVYQAHFSMEAGPLNLVRPEVSVELAAVVAKMMAKEPGRRFETPGEVARALTPFFKPAETRPAGRSAKMSRPQAQAPSAERSGAVPAPAQPAPPPSVPARAGQTPSKRGPDGVAWESLIEIKETKRPVAAGSAVAPARRPPWVWPAAVVGLLTFGLFGMWLGGGLRVTTPEGVIVLENLPNDAEVLVDGRKITLSWPGIGKPVEIRAVPGQRKVEVKKDGFSTFAKELDVKADGSAEVAVRLEPLDAGLSNPKTSQIATASAPANAGDIFPVKGTKYRLVNVESRKALEARERVVVEPNVSHRVVVQADVSDNENQFWYFSEVADTGKYKIFNSQNNLLINISNAGPERFSIILYPDIGGEEGEDNAVWFLRFDGRAVRIATTWRAVLSSSDVNVLTIPGGSRDEERAVQRPRMDGRNELWECVEVSPKTGAIGTDGRPPVAPTVAERQLVLRSPAERRASVTRGKWKREGDELIQTSLETDTELVFGDQNWSHYDLSLEVKKDTEAVDGRRFTVLFHRMNDKTKCWYSGYSNAHEIASALDGRWSRDWERRRGNWVSPRKDELQDGRWYAVKIEVRSRSVKCYFDNKLMFDDAHPSLSHGQIGLGSYSARVCFRRIKITDPNGRVLFEGLPEIDPAGVDVRKIEIKEPPSATKEPIPAKTALDAKPPSARRKRSARKPTKMAGFDGLQPGTVWIGQRTYRKGGYAGSTVSYFLHIRERTGGKFKAQKFDNGRGRNGVEVVGEVHGADIAWNEIVGNSVLNMRGAIGGDTIQIEFAGVYANGVATEGDGWLVLSETTNPALFDAFLAVFAPGMRLSTQAVGHGGMAFLDHFNHPGVLRTHPVGRDSPCVLTTEVAIPAGVQTMLLLEVAHHAQKSDWNLVVRADGRTIHDSIVGSNTTQAGWAVINVDLSGFAGRKVRLELLNQANDWSFEFGYWGRVAIVSGRGSKGKTIQKHPH